MVRGEVFRRGIATVPGPLLQGNPSWELVSLAAITCV